MHGWASIETARCGRCTVFTDKTELILGADGAPYCSDCLPFAKKAPTSKPRHAATQAPTPTPTEEWVGAIRPAPLESKARMVALAMLILTLAFPLAACMSSQL